MNRLNVRPDLDVPMVTTPTEVRSDVEGGSVWMISQEGEMMSLIQSFADLFEVIESLFEFILLALFVL